ncbi:sugar ABC transporter substrate-binding protein [uncultured Leifsonia sp.]|uniref:ABC transporter substrate-binding protein n=1 Tax=uncultured Leifsonia sp. TaxID=340359 RepID=UPI0028D1D697|nr:sugar ABC transporter substrate-binding protein [uncultured Leifsonia sp.]
MRSRFARLSTVGLAVAAAAALALSGCSGSGGSGDSGAEGTYVAPKSDVSAHLTISNWGNPGDEKVYQAAIDRFNKKYPNVKVTNNFTQVVNWSDYINKILTSIASGDAPDVINIATEGVEFGYSKDLFLSLSNYVKQDKGVESLISDINPNLIKGFQKDGKTYLLPNNWNAMMMYYNTKLFQNAGIQRPSDDWTWNDFLDIATKLTTGSGGSKTYGFGLQTYTFAYMPWLYTNGGSTASDDLSKPTLDSEKTVEAVQFLQDLVRKYGVAPDPSGADANSLFTASKIAMTAAPANLSATLAGDPTAPKFDILPMPKNSVKSTVFGAAGFAIYKGSKNKDLSWELLKELASQQTQAAWAKLGTSNPTTKSAATSEAFTSGRPHADLLYNSIEYAKPVAAPKFFTTLEPAFQRALQSVMAGGDPKAELTKANDEVKAAIGNG